MPLRVTLISHASVLIETADVVIWTDPWITGRAFNESWALLPRPTESSVEKAIQKTTHLWLSHEHPDHFHIPTLRMLPADFKKRVALLFQYFPTDKMIDTFRKLGFTNIVTIKHRESLKISHDTCVYLYQSSQKDTLDSIDSIVQKAPHLLPEYLQMVL